jgi:hypothetical protein
MVNLKRCVLFLIFLLLCFGWKTAVAQKPYPRQVT